MNDRKAQIIIEGGKHLAQVKRNLIATIVAGVTPLEIDRLADQLIAKLGDQSSFKTVPGYYHTTCINTNQDMLHGLPNNVPFQPSDVVTVDVGLIHKDYHLDTSFTLQIPPLKPQVSHFLQIGQKALKKAIAAARPGNSIFDISLAMQRTVEAAGFSVATQVVGHGIGRKLHLPPQIPCFASQSDKKIILKVGQTLAVEIMYAQGSADLKIAPDGWTLTTKDNSLSAMFEETILITVQGRQILT